jgi:hypothetical protein
MTTVITILVIVAMIRVAVLLIRMANARNTVLPTTARPARHRRLPWLGSTAGHPGQRPHHHP